MSVSFMISQTYILLVDSSTGRQIRFLQFVQLPTNSHLNSVALIIHTSSASDSDVFDSI